MASVDTLNNSRANSASESPMDIKPKRRICLRKSPTNQIAPIKSVIEACDIIANHRGTSPVYQLYRKSAAYIRQQNLELKYSNDAKQVSAQYSLNPGKKASERKVLFSQKGRSTKPEQDYGVEEETITRNNNITNNTF